MRGRLIALALAMLVLQVPGPGAARVYEGREAGALRCVNMIAHTAVSLWQAGLLPEQEKDLMLDVAVLMLDRHVSGTWQQKKAALKQVRDRRDSLATLRDYQENAARCIEQYPIA